jgi:hypothetical protein
MATGQTLGGKNAGEKSPALQRIISYRNINKVVPVISNSFRIEQVFRGEKKITERIAKCRSITMKTLR